MSILTPKTAKVGIVESTERTQDSHNSKGLGKAESENQKRATNTQNYKKLSQQKTDLLMFVYSKKFLCVIIICLGIYAILGVALNSFTGSAQFKGMILNDIGTTILNSLNWGWNSILTIILGLFLGKITK